MMRRIDDYPLEIMISLALAVGTYAIAIPLGISGPIAVVVAGLLIGNHATRYAMSETTRRNLILFWSVIDELLNAWLFLLLGFEILGIDFDSAFLIAAIPAIPLAIIVRGISVVVPVIGLHTRDSRRWSGVAVLTWGALRGGISVAMALNLPPTPWRSELLFVCYAVVLFTIIVQGLTIERVIRWTFPASRGPEE
jgi:CPA1 family monovalent cation:H+ antiporter